MVHNPAQVGPFRCGRGEPLLVIAGPCVIEDERLTSSQRLARTENNVHELVKRVRALSSGVRASAEPT